MNTGDYPKDDLDAMQAEWDEVMLSADYQSALLEYEAKKKTRWHDPERCERCGDTCELKDGSVCPACCPHDETDHHICLACGRDCLDDAIDRAELQHGASHAI